MILIDTTPLVALCDGRDAYHKRAVRHLADLAKSNFGTCDGVITESCFHLPHRSQRLRFRMLLEQLDALLLPAAPDRQFHDEVFGWLLQYAEHEPDWTDGCLAVLSARHPEAKVWTYDREFRTTWRRPDGTRIPLAVT